MKKGMINSTLIHEERRSVVLFLWLFYIISVSYDILFFNILPQYVIEGPTDSMREGLGYWFYVILFALLPISLYLMRVGKPNAIKYMYFVSYIFISIIHEVLIYMDSALKYQSGNAVEVFLVLFSPIFVNRRYFFVVCLGMILKYTSVGIILQNVEVLIPIALLCVLSLIAFILLNRFKGYVNAVSHAYDQQLERMVKGVIATLELKDPYTRGHSERVAQYAQILAKATNQYSRDELKTFNYACLLHDIGKVNIPDRILMKPSRLTNEEFDVIKSHPVVGAHVIKDVEGLSGVIDVIRYHHERWDGKGYPEQLKGEEIPFLARITSVADAFDAMTSSRSYRKALPLEEAYRRIVEGRGSQFDPQVVDLFEKEFPKWKKVYESYPWDQPSGLELLVEAQAYLKQGGEERNENPQA
ncbi:HD-GYP domain-containing protein [Bacillus kexueae]|uniref:HD-GYP domain-containing protein n=1 Tax=Aeribacillus kexueae TaxID=2078952 RepID=UPI001FAFE122|nr:HD-GYP domain-containing protein [Bacillus kexueae]